MYMIIVSLSFDETETLQYTIYHSETQLLCKHSERADLFLHYLCKNNLAAVRISCYANSQEHQFSPITSLFFLLKLALLQRQLVFGMETIRKE